MNSKLSGHTILIVNNDPERRRLLKAKLQPDAAPFSFIEKATVGEAAELLQTVAVDALFVAEQLPDAHALTWLPVVRGISHCQQLPIFVTLEKESLTKIKSLLEAGATFCLALSQTSPLLLQQMLTAADGRQAREPRKGTLPSIPLEERVRLAFEAAQMGYWEWDIQADRVRWRYQAESIFGIENKPFDGTMQAVLGLIHPDDRHQVERALQTSLATGEDYKVEFRVTNPPPETRWLTGNGRTFFDETGQPSLMIGVLRDVTERMVAEAQIRASQQLNQAILDSLPEHIAVLDPRGNILTINKAWQDFAIQNGLGAEAVHATIGTNYLEVCESATGECAGEAAAVCQGIRDVLSGKAEHFRLEYPCHSPAEERWFLMQVTPLIHGGDGVVVSHLNITERRKNETEMQLAKESAEQANRAKDEFITQITHDLRSPLSAVLGWAKVLKNKAITEQLREEAVQNIIESAEKQNNLIEDLLDVSRMTAGKLRLDVMPVSLNAVIRSAMEVMKPACDAKEIACVTELTTDADDVTGDPVRLEQVIWNLVSNAVKFTPNKGEVKVRLERADPHVRIIVSDTGCGIKTEHLPFVFDRYWQPAATGNKRKGGLGLGLSLVKHIVELHGGTVAVESEGEHRGATFTVNLPYRAVRLSAEPVILVTAGEFAHEPDSFLASTLSSTALSGLLILVVDDEVSARELVAEILRQHGATVRKADSAATALHFLTTDGPVPDLLVSDISMPDEDGYMLIQKIRSLPLHQGRNIPAVALTAFGRPEDRIRALDAGFSMHVPKPVEPAELALVAANLTNRDITNFG